MSEKINANVVDNKKTIMAWTFYDWANSVYNLVITSTIFPAYYEGITAAQGGFVSLFGRKFVNTALYDYTLAFAFILVAISSPLFSAIADSKGNKKSFLRFFATLGSVSCMGLYFFTPQNLSIGILFFMLACYGFWSSLVFYNSYLPQIASEANRDKVSARGFAMGYIGSVTLQLLCFVLIFNKEWFGISIEDKTTAPRICFILVGLWWFGFAQIPLFILPKGIPNESGQKLSIWKAGYKTLHNVWLQLHHIKNIKQYLLSFFFYNMGVQTIMLVAVLFSKKVLKMETPQLITTVLIIQIIAVVGAWLMARLSKKFGNIHTIMITLIVWMGVCIAAYNVTTAQQFYFVAGVVGFVMGGIQSMSRSTYSKLIPSDVNTASFFSFFDVTEKIAIAVGLLSYGLIEEITGSMQNSIGVLFAFFFIGFLILIPIRKTI